MSNESNQEAVTISNWSDEPIRGSFDVTLKQLREPDDAVRRKADDELLKPFADDDDDQIDRIKQLNEQIVHIRQLVAEFNERRKMLCQS